MEIEDTALYKHCLRRCASEELKLNLKTELEIVRDSGIEVNWEVSLPIAFKYRISPQGYEFWYTINHLRLPKEYQ